MKHLLVVCTLFCSSYGFCDYIDFITVFVNGSKIAATDELKHNENLVIDSLNLGDTLSFVAWTDWSELRHAKLEIIDQNGVIFKQLDQSYYKQYGAKFDLIIDKTFFGKRLQLRFVYNEGPVSFWYFGELYLQS